MFGSIGASSAVAEPHPDDQIELTAEEREALAAALAAGETIEVIANKPIVADAPGTEEVKRDELHVMAGSRGDAISAVRNLPGIANADAYDGGGVLAIRGTSGEDSIALVDDVAIPIAMHFGNVQSILPTEMIEKIELKPGGFDVEHGRATGGVLSIVTRTSYPTEWSGFTELSFINAAGFIEGPLLADHNLTVAASFRRSIIDALLPAIIPDDAPVSFKTPPRYYDGQLRLNWAPNAYHEVTLLGFGSDDRTTVAIESVDPLDPVITGEIAGRESFWRTTLRWHYERGDIENTATASYGRDHREQTLNTDELFYRLSPQVFYARDAFAWRAGDKLRIRAGGDVNATHGNIAAHITLPSGEGSDDPILASDPLIVYDKTTTETMTAGWLAADVSPTKAITVTPGVRVDHFSRSGATKLQPRLSATVALAPHLSIRAAAGSYSRPLILAEQLRDDLQPERAYHAAGGAEIALADGVKLSATGFLTEMRDMVVRDNDFMGEDALDAYSNDGRGQVIGAELLVRVAHDNLSGWLAYTASRSSRIDGPEMESRAFDYDQPHNLVATGSYKLGQWRFGGRVQVTSGTPTTPIVGSIYNADKNFYEPVHGPNNSERTDLHHQLDVRVDRRFVIGSMILDVFLDVSNVYANPRHLGRDYSFDYAESQPVTDTPILPSFGLRGTF